MSLRQNLWVPSPQLSSPILQPWLVFSFVYTGLWVQDSIMSFLQTWFRTTGNISFSCHSPWYLLRKDLWPMAMCFLSTPFSLIDCEHQRLHWLDWFVHKGALEVSNVDAIVRRVRGLCGLCPWLSSTWVLHENMYRGEKKFALEQMRICSRPNLSPSCTDLRSFYGKFYTDLLP